MNTLPAQLQGVPIRLVGDVSEGSSPDRWMKRTSAAAATLPWGTTELRVGDRFAGAVRDGEAERPATLTVTALRDDGDGGTEVRFEADLGPG